MYDFMFNKYLFNILYYKAVFHISKVNSSLIHILVPLGSELSGGRIDTIEFDGKETMVGTVFHEVQY